MKKFKILDFLTVIVLVAMIASLIYAFSELYLYKSDTTTAEQQTTTLPPNVIDPNWQPPRITFDGQEKLIKEAQNIQPIQPIEQPDFDINY